MIFLDSTRFGEHVRWSVFEGAVYEVHQTLTYGDARIRKREIIDIPCPPTERAWDMMISRTLCTSK
jgi:hypothetical protein